MKMTTRRTGTVAAAIVLLCHAPAPWAEGAPDSTPFAQALSRDYQALSAVESAQGDERDAASYARRSLDAAAGTCRCGDTHRTGNRRVAAGFPERASRSGTHGGAPAADGGLR